MAHDKLFGFEWNFYELREKTMKIFMSFAIKMTIASIGRKLDKKIKVNRPEIGNDNEFCSFAHVTRLLLVLRRKKNFYWANNDWDLFIFALDIGNILGKAYKCIRYSAYPKLRFR